MGEEENDPFTPLAGAAVAMHEMVSSLTNAGFTRSEAIQILIAMLTKEMR